MAHGRRCKDVATEIQTIEVVHDGKQMVSNGARSGLPTDDCFPRDLRAIGKQSMLKDSMSRCDGILASGAVRAFDQQFQHAGHVIPDRDAPFQILSGRAHTEAAG